MALYAFDGTWNKERDAGEYGKNTNVVKFHQAYTGKINFYTKGVGAKLGFLGKIFGGAFGVGGKERIRKAYDEFCQAYKAGDTEIDIVGFSRGAALAVHFANTIQSKGARDPKTGKTIQKSPPIRFLGLWDVVASFGIPFDVFGIPFHWINLGYKLTLAENVRHCFHALALDERRQTFRPTRIRGGYEVWFRGEHSDVGGGNENIGLNNIALRWMMKKALAVGLPIDPGALAALGAGINPDAPIKPPFDIIKQEFRKVTAADWVHYTVKPRDPAKHNNPPADAKGETAEDEERRRELV